MTTIKTYRNKRNPNKYLEVHNDGHYHNSFNHKNLQTALRALYAKRHQEYINTESA